MSSTTPQPLDVFFVYHDERFCLQVLQRGPMAYGVTCPCCHTTLQFNPETHHLIVNLSTRRLSIRPSEIQCPRSECGWHVAISNGVARDLDSSSPSAVVEIAIPLTRCWNCGSSCPQSKRGLCGYCGAVIGNELGGGGVGGFRRQAPVKGRRGRKMDSRPRLFRGDGRCKID